MTITQAFTRINVMTRNCASAAFALAIPLLALDSKAARCEPTLDEGRDIAARHCARCHVIPSHNNMGIGSTPSFKLMVRSKSGDWRSKFEAFYTLPPHLNFVRIKGVPKHIDLPAVVAEIHMTFEEIDSLMVYVDDLARQFRK